MNYILSSVHHYNEIEIDLLTSPLAAVEAVMVHEQLGISQRSYK